MLLKIGTASTLVLYFVCVISCIYLVYVVFRVMLNIQDFHRCQIVVVKNYTQVDSTCGWLLCPKLLHFDNLLFKLLSLVIKLQMQRQFAVFIFTCRTK